MECLTVVAFVQNRSNQDQVCITIPQPTIPRSSDSVVKSVDKGSRISPAWKSTAAATPKNISMFVMCVGKSSTLEERIGYTESGTLIHFLTGAVIVVSFSNTPHYFLFTKSVNTQAKDHLSALIAF